MKTNRRNFIRTSAVTAAGLGLIPSLTGRAFSMRNIQGANDRVTLALIGARNMGFGDLEDLLKQPNVECKTLCDVDDAVLESRAADLVNNGHKKPLLEKDYRRVIEDRDIDAVVVGTPDHWHCLPTVEACEAGKHVYVEKPLANSIGEINVMLDRAREYRSIVQVGQQQRSGAHWKTAMAFLRTGKLGTIRQVKFWGNFNYGAGAMPVPDSDPPEGVDYDRWLGPAPRRPFNSNRFHGMWRMFRDYGGGLMTDWGVHLIDMGLWAMNVKGAPLSVQAIGGNFASRERALEMPDTLTVLYEMEGYNMIWEHNGGIETGPYGQSYGVKFIGSNGTLVADRDHWRVFPEGSGDDLRMEPVEEQKSDYRSHVDHCANFINAIREGEELAAEIGIGHLSALYAHLGNISFWSGEKVVYDMEARKITSSVRANDLVTPVYREPWVFPG